VFPSFGRVANVKPGLAVCMVDLQGLVTPAWRSKVGIAPRAVGKGRRGSQLRSYGNSKSKSAVLRSRVAYNLAKAKLLGDLAVKRGEIHLMKTNSKIKSKSRISSLSEIRRIAVCNRVVCNAYA